MLIWIIQVIIFSIILIFLVHHLILFFKSTLTVPKIKDLVNTSTQKYESMFNIISNKENNVTSSYKESDYSIIDLLPKQEDTSMKSELKNFLKKQLTNSNVNNNNNNNNSSNNFSTEISAIDTMIGSNSYSDY
jgi:cell shape-determining protein MreC